jgi:hypothetical protein
MKLFTLFTTDERAVAHVRAERRRIATVVKRVANHQEWGVRVVLDRGKDAKAARKKENASPGGQSGLTTSRARKRSATRWWSLPLTRMRRLRRCTIGLLPARDWRNGRLASDLPVQGGPLLLDAAFLVPRTRAASFRRLQPANRARSRATATGSP